VPGGADGDGGARRAANEATVTDWDPVSKQPLFKSCAAGIRLLERGNGSLAPAPTNTASAPAGGAPGPAPDASPRTAPREGARP
jgi:hypothetical protein